MGEGAIAVDGVVKRFGGVAALDGIDFSVAAGTVFGLLGPNGAGKTTAVRVLATILSPDGGRAEVLGHDVVREARAVRRLIGLAGQYAAVDANLTARENLRLMGRLAQLPRRTLGPRANELLEAFDLGQAAERPVRTYSGGMRRRLDLAAALVHRPPILFLDEPTTGLDPEGRAGLWKMIRELVRDGTTVLLTTQYLEEADRLAHRIAVVDHGRVIAEGTPGELKARLGNTVIEIEMADETDALQAIAALTHSARNAPEREGRVVRLKSEQGARGLTDVLRLLDTDGLEPATIGLRQPSLDDVFLTLTGRHAGSGAVRDEEAAVTGVRR